jgi:hypothetical protein
MPPLPLTALSPTLFASLRQKTKEKIKEFTMNDMNGYE